MAGSLPIAVAIAASPFAIIPAILLLLTPRPSATAGSFLGGWLAGVGVGTGVSLLLADLLDAVDVAPEWAAWARILLGVALVAYAVTLWRTRAADAALPAWLQSIQGATPGRAARLGLLLSLANPKVLLLSVAGGLSIGAEVVGAGSQVVAVVLFSAVASVTVAVPLLAYLVARERALGPLRRANGWLERNHAAVMAVVVLLIGVLLLVKGLQAL